MTNDRCVYCGYENGEHNEVCVAAENARLRGLLAERQDAWCDEPLPGRSYPDYACGKCWTCRIRAALAGSSGETSDKVPNTEVARALMEWKDAGGDVYRVVDEIGKLIDLKLTHPSYMPASFQLKTSLTQCLYRSGCKNPEVCQNAGCCVPGGVGT